MTADPNSNGQRATAASGRQARHRIRRRDMLAVIALILLTLLAALGLVGFPPSIRNAIIRRINADRPYVIQVQAIRFQLPFDVVLDQPRLFQRGIAGPPVMEAGRVALSVNPAQWTRRRTGIRRIRIDHGIIRRPTTRPDEPSRPVAWWLPDGERGQVEWRRLTVTDLPLAHGSLDYRVEGPWLRMDRIHAVLQPDETAGVVRGRCDVHLAERRYQGQATGSACPQRLIPMTLAWGQDVDHILERFDFPNGLPTGDITFAGQLQGANLSFEGSGHVTASHGVYRGVPIAAAKADLAIQYDATQSRMDVRQAAIVFKDGLATGTAQCDYRTGMVTVNFDGAMSPLIPATMLGLTLPTALQDLRFEGPLRWTAHGWASYRDRGMADLHFQGEGRRVRYQNYLADRLSVTAHYDGQAVAFSTIDAALFGGAARGTAAIERTGPDDPEDAAPPYRFELQLEDLDFPKLIAAAAGARNPDFYEGRLSATINARGRAETDWLPAMTADGHLRIRQGRLFRIPLFGGLSQILSRLIPGMDMVLLQTSARSDFAIDQNRLTVRDARIEGDVFNVEGRGAYTFQGDLDFQVQLKLLKDQTVIGTAVRVITFPISKLFEFRLRGSLDKPRWYPINFSSDLLERLRGLIE